MKKESGHSEAKEVLIATPSPGNISMAVDILMRRAEVIQLL
jgi:hypothetical protein